jgi:hypothetical protein
MRLPAMPPDPPALEPPVVTVISVPGGPAMCQRRRFTRLLGKVWARLPANMRTALEEHWRAGLPHQWPHLYLADLLTAQDGKGSREYFGRCRKDGQHLQFNAYEVAKVPDRFVAAVIAHELIHAWGFASGTSQTEDEVDARVELLGFPGNKVRAFVDWLGQEAARHGQSTSEYLVEAPGWRQGWTPADGPQQ